MIGVAIGTEYEITGTIQDFSSFYDKSKGLSTIQNGNTLRVIPEDKNYKEFLPLQHPMKKIY